MIWYGILWLKQCHEPPMTGNGNHTTCENGDLGIGLFLFYPHYVYIYIHIIIIKLTIDFAYDFLHAPIISYVCYMIQIHIVED